MNLYSIHEELHRVILEKATKYGLNIVIENKNTVLCPEFLCKECGTIGKFEDFRFTFFKNECKYCGFEESNLADPQKITRLKPDVIAIQSSQIRKILLTFKTVLGANADYAPFEWVTLSDCCKTQAEALCCEWLDGLEPQIEKDELSVLQQLLETLNEI